jgi:hypothetical protein
VRTTTLGRSIETGAHRRHLGVAALVLWLAAIGATVLLWSSAAGSGCVPPSVETCVREDVRR